MDVLVIVIEVFIGGGLFVIFLAPALKLFKKAGRKPWLALVPGANVVNFTKICGQPFSIASLFSLVVFPTFWLLFNILTLQGETIDYGAMIGGSVVILLAAAFLFCFPMLSTGMMFGITYLLAISPPPVGIVLIITAIIFILAAIQAIWDVMSWVALLKKLHLPIWHLVFILLPLAVILVEALISLAFRTSSVFPFVLGTFLPALFIGFVYYYYIGYSAKVRYRIE
jgi:hypothetical protein